MKTSSALLLSSSVSAATLESRASDPCASLTPLLNQSRIVPGQAAADCLYSFPYNDTAAHTFLDEIRKYVQFQSTIEILQNPPDTYNSPAYDILGALDQIASNYYDNHFQFDRDLLRAINSANDGHFWFTPCTSMPFTFYREEVGLVSISKDGVAVPEIYAGSDVEALVEGIDTVSPVEKINNQINQGNWGNYTGFGRFTTDQFVWPGVNSTTLQFKNGSTLELKTYAKYNWDVFPQSIEHMYEITCTPNQVSSSSSKRSSLATRTVIDRHTKRQDSSEPTKTAAPLGYGTPFLRDPYNKMVGYFLDDETTVIAVASGRTKMIVDLTANSGGSITQGFDLFKLFFPDLFPYSGTRMRLHEGLESLLDIYRIYSADECPGSVSPFCPGAWVTPDQTSSFDSISSFIQGDVQYDVNVTAPLIANFNYTQSTIRGFSSSYPANNTRPFDASDIVIITDGQCTSTCTTFTNLMTWVGNVTSVTFGGRPTTGPMQVMGGVRGAQSYHFDTLDDVILTASNITQTNEEVLSASQLAKARESLPIGLKNLPFYVDGGGFNLRNAYQEGDDELPLQFQYQASDCRLFYTAENILRPITTWAAAKTAIWGDGLCVANSTGGLNSVYGRKGETSPYKEEGSAGGKNETGTGTGTGTGDGTFGSTGHHLQTGGSILALSIFTAAFAVLM
ncbi:hypothetical protein GGR57DRAFT_504603 [Xylariaceae sp. FL1272]|nr:hypothetical protein GGR57DRAFT_504603 [Xylariaceae sp. FL1272]